MVDLTPPLASSDVGDETNPNLVTSLLSINLHWQLLNCYLLDSLSMMMVSLLIVVSCLIFWGHLELETNNCQLHVVELRRVLIASTFSVLNKSVFHVTVGSHRQWNVLTVHIQQYCLWHNFNNQAQSINQPTNQSKIPMNQ